MVRPTSENLRKKVIEGCLRLFLHRNLGAVTIDDLVIYSECSRRSIYHYFKSKEDVFFEVTEYFLKKLVSYHTRFCSEKKNSLLDYIIAYIDYIKNLSLYVRAMTGNKMSSHLYFMAQAAEYCPGFAEKAEPLFAQEQESWKNSLRIAINKKEIRSNIDVTQTATKFCCLSMGVGFQSMQQPDNVSLNTLQLLLIDLYNDIKVRQEKDFV